MIESSRKVAPWREAVVQAVMLQSPPGARTDPILFRGPVALDVTFTLARPKSAKPGARPAGRPDIDKLVRSTLDALTTAGVFEDDGRVVSLITQKYYVGHDPNFDDNILAVPGAFIEVNCQ
jgi:Holliday junction resolvase RusA-like endonuclease